MIRVTRAVHIGNKSVGRSTVGKDPDPFAGKIQPASFEYREPK
jgi:hypothetical protein